MKLFLLLFFILGELMAANSGWQTSVDSDPITDKKIVTMVKLSSKGSNVYDKKIRLIVRCTQDASPEVYVSWGDYLGENSLVISRIDKKKPIEQYWGISSDHTASFYPSEQTGKLISDFMKYNTYAVRTEPYNASPVTAVFSLTGFTKTIKPYLNICGLLDQKDKQKLLSKGINNKKQCIGAGYIWTWNGEYNKWLCINDNGTPINLPKQSQESIKYLGDAKSYIKKADYHKQWLFKTIRLSKKYNNSGDYICGLHKKSDEKIAVWYFYEKKLYYINSNAKTLTPQLNAYKTPNIKNDIEYCKNKFD